MPSLTIDLDKLKLWGECWLGTTASYPGAPQPVRRSIKTKGKKTAKRRTKKPDRFEKKQSMEFGRAFDEAFGDALAVMLGNGPVEQPKPWSLLPVGSDCVEVGTTRIVGGIRPQNFDAAYRPDGPRVVFDSKTLNDSKSVAKNWQNMVNDLATEASTVHTRFPMCIVCFIVIIPRPALAAAQERDIIRTLERLGSRRSELDQHHLAEAIALVVWDPATGLIEENVPPQGSPLRLGKLNKTVYAAYRDRYQNLPPHQESSPDETGEGYLTVES